MLVCLCVELLEFPAGGTKYMLCVVVMYNLRYMFDIIMRVLYVRLLRENEIYILSDSYGLFW